MKARDCVLVWGLKKTPVMRYDEGPSIYATVLGYKEDDTDYWGRSYYICLKVGGEKRNLYWGSIDTTAEEHKHWIRLAFRQLEIFQ